MKMTPYTIETDYKSTCHYNQMAHYDDYDDDDVGLGTSSDLRSAFQNNELDRKAWSLASS